MNTQLAKSFVSWGVVMSIVWGIFGFITLFLFSSEKDNANLLLSKHLSENLPFIYKIIGIWVICGFLSGIYLRRGLIQMQKKIERDKKSATYLERKKWHSLMSTGYALFAGATICALYCYLNIPVDVTLKSIWWRLLLGLIGARFATIIALNILYRNNEIWKINK